MNKITLGVHLIVKDEAEHLPRCLASIQGADEIVVVDTGSVDDSMTIAREHGAKVFQREWKHDFSAARNEGLAHAATDWILVIDADEALNTPLTEFQKILQDPAIQAFTVGIKNGFGARPEDSVNHRAVRLFRNGQGYRYSGRIHEGVDLSILNKHSSSSIGDSHIEIIHYGYMPDLMARKNKIKRNEELLRLALAEHPGDEFYSYNLAVTFCQDGRVDEAEQLLLQTIRQGSLQASYRPAMIRDLCKIYLSRKKLQAMDSLLAVELERYADYSDLHYLQGQSLEDQGLLERAFLSYQRAESLSGNTSAEKYVSEKGMSTFRPLCRMGVISRRLGHIEEAARLFHRALQHHSLYAPALHGIASAFQHLAVPDGDIASLLLQLVNPGTPAARSAIIETLHGISAFETIAALPRDIFPIEPATAVWFLSALIITGRTCEVQQIMTETTLQHYHERMTEDSRRELWNIRAISQWMLSGCLQNDAHDDMPEALATGLKYIDHRLKEDETGQAERTPPVTLSRLITKVIHQAVKLQQFTLGSRLADLFPGHRAELAAALYREGHMEAAGEMFITLVREQQTEGKIPFYIGEMLYDKGHYAEAAEWFQQMLAQDHGEEAASIGLSLCYLQLARISMEEALRELNDAPGNGPLQKDMTHIRQAIQLLDRTPWHTQWSFRQLQGRDVL